MIYLFVLDESLTSQTFTTRTEELTKCYEPLQKLRVRLGTCKIDLSPPVIVPRRYFCGGSFVLCLGVKILCCWMVTFLVMLLMVYTFRNLLGLLQSAIMLQTSTLEINV